MAYAGAELVAQMVERKIASTDAPDSLRQIAAAVHDWWFDIDDAIVDETGVVMLRLAQSIKALRDGTGPSRMLKIRSVSRVIIEDIQKVGIYDVEEIAYDELDRRLVLYGGVPVTVSFVVSRLDVTVIERAD